MNLRYFLREVLTNIQRSPLMSVASVSTVMVLALILGLFVLLVVNLDALARELSSELRVVVAYLEDGFSRERVGPLRGRVLEIEHVESVHFVSKETAFNHLRERLGASVTLEDVTANPLPDTLEIQVSDPRHLAQVATAVQGLRGVAHMRYGREEARKVLALNQVVRWTGAIILALLFLSTVLIVSNTIRLTVFARRREIEIMQLVGAAGWFIRWPFVLEGVFHGLVGSALAAALVDLSYRAVVPQLHASVPFLPVLGPGEVLPLLVLALVGIGACVGALGSLISVNRYLDV